MDYTVFDNDGLCIVYNCGIINYPAVVKKFILLAAKYFLFVPIICPHDNILQYPVRNMVGTENKVHNGHNMCAIWFSCYSIVMNVCFQFTNYLSVLKRTHQSTIGSFFSKDKYTMIVYKSSPFYNIITRPACISMKMKELLFLVNC